MAAAFAAAEGAVAQQVDVESDGDAMSRPLVTDRPDFTESTDAVPTGHVQLEAGYTFTYDREDGDRTGDHTAPELLLRVGLRENFELRIGWNGYSWTDSHSSGGAAPSTDDWNQGANDLSLGFKYKFFEQEGYVPHMGVIGAINVPSGNDDVGSGDVDPELVFLWAYDISDSFSIAGNVGLAVPTEDGSRFVQTFASLSAAVALTDRVGAYAEYFGFYPNADSSDSAHTANVGLTYLINNNFQVDVRVGAGLNEEADDFFTGVGFAWRF